MSLQADVFDPEVVRAAVKALIHSNAAKQKFETDWKANVNKRVNVWRSHKDNKRTPVFQLQWESEVIQYVDYIHSKLSVHGNSSALAKDAIHTLDKSIPFLGPKFSPPSYLHGMRRKATPTIRPEEAYISAMTVVHPVYYPNVFTSCPKCDSESIAWDSWNGTGARSVYGIRKNERAIGYQLRCKSCKESKASDGYCFATTNCTLWEKWEHWRIPRSIPHFLKRAAVTHELYDLIVELRPSSTSAGLAEHFKQLHLLEYHQRMLEYLLYFKSGRQNRLLQRNSVQPFSSPTDENGYGDCYITNDLITDLYLDFIAKGRKSESIEYAQSRTAKSVSLDNTFKSSAKATIVDGNGARQNLMNGGVLSSINEEGEGLSWRFCLSYSAAEIREMLIELRKRHEELGLPLPTSVTVDNCCQVRRFIREALGPDVAVCLDVYHFIIRYGATILGGNRNPRRKEVLSDIRSAIIKTPAQKNRPATYWTQPEQEIKLVEAYNKWLQCGGIWSAAASKVHADQLEHVRKGCLARPREDIAMDGSRIEGSHKGWNSLQRAHSSGLEVYTGLAFDFFLRRNIRIGWSRVENKRRGINCYEFVESTHSSHHIQLVNYSATLFNSLLEKEAASVISKNGLCAYPTLPHIQSQESMGLVKSAHTQTYGGLVEADPSNTASPDPDMCMLEDVDAELAELDQGRLVRSLNVDEQMLHVPLTAGDQLTSAAKTSPQQKRKGHVGVQLAQIKDRGAHISGSHSDDSTMPSDHKRRRTAASPSPSTRAEIGLPTSSLQHDVETEESAVLDLGMEEITEFCETLSPMDCEPTDAVIGSDIPLPDGPNTMNAATGALVPHALFQFQTHHNNLAATPSSKSATQLTSLNASRDAGNILRRQAVLDDLRRPLKLPEVLRARNLTRSALMFSIGTSIDPRALEIQGDEEFYLFMDLRAQEQWTSLGMTHQKWASAAKIYNTQLQERSKIKGFKFIKKNPQALSKKLNEIEPKILDRISRGDYTSRKSNNETFWRRHCSAVPAVTGKAEAGIDFSDLPNGSAADGQAGPSNLPQLKQRKRPVCSRCKTLMYTNRPGSKVSNHKKGYCADGARSIEPKKKGQAILNNTVDESSAAHAANGGHGDANDEFNAGNDARIEDSNRFNDLLPPPWPQPHGIFAMGSVFNPEVFLRTVRDLFEKIADHEARGLNPAITYDYMLEDIAFSQMLRSRTDIIDEHTYFRLYDLTLSSGSAYESLIFNLVVDGHPGRYLRIDCL